MATKEQERKALKEIVKIVEGLGEGSYLSMAFEGCFDMAESNIDNDFGNSPKKAIENLSKKISDMKLVIENKKEEVVILNDELKRQKEEYESVIRGINKTHKNEIEFRDSEIEKLKKDIKIWQDEFNKTDRKADIMAIKLADAEMEIIKLKARLFDMMEEQNN